MHELAADTAQPQVTDRAAWQAQLDELLVREKAHTREGDAIAAARRRLPMVEVDAAIPLIGEHGPVPLLDVFEGRRQLIVYFHMWHDGKPAAEQCEGCTFFNGQVRELSYLHSRDVTYATFCQGPYAESIAYRDFMGWDVPWYSARDSADALLAGRWFGMTVCYLRRRRPGVRDLLDQRPWRGGAGAQLRAARHDRVRPCRRPGRTLRPAGPSPSAPAASSSAPTGAPPRAVRSRLTAGRSDDLTAGD